MWKALSRLFSGPPSPRAADQAMPPRQSAPPDDAPVPTHAASSDPAHLEACFSSWLLGLAEYDKGPASEPANAAEQALLARLEQLLAASEAASLVPRLPATLPRLMGMVRRDDVSPRELAEHLARDPVLLGEVIRIANSPRYRPAREIASLEEAVLLLGQDGLQQVVARAMLSPVFSARQGRFSGAASKRLWEQAERCAHACAFLRQGRPDRFEAYLAGMVANTGMIAALRSLDQACQTSDAPRSLGFHAALADVASRLSARIASQWEFPDEAVDALQARSRPLMSGASSLARALQAADRSSKRHLLGAQPADVLEARCMAELQGSFGPSAMAGAA